MTYHSKASIILQRIRGFYSGFWDMGIITRIMVCRTKRRRRWNLAKARRIFWITTIRGRIAIFWDSRAPVFEFYFGICSHLWGYRIHLALHTWPLRWKPRLATRPSFTFLEVARKNICFKALVLCKCRVLRALLLARLIVMTERRCRIYPLIDTRANLTIFPTIFEIVRLLRWRKTSDKTWGWSFVIKLAGTHYCRGIRFQGWSLGSEHSIPVSVGQVSNKQGYLHHI